MSLSSIKDKNGDAKGFLAGGYTQSEREKQANEETFWLLYLDKNGREIWRKYVEGKSKKSEERLASAELVNDGAYILAGTSADEPGMENWKIVLLGDKQIEELIENQPIRIYPNPVQDYCYVEIGVDFRQATIEIYDMNGRLAHSQQTQNRVTKVNTAALVQGAYVVKATTEKERVTGKILKK